MGSGGEVTLPDDLTVATDVFHVDSLTGFVGIGTLTPTAELEVVDDGSVAFAKLTGYRAAT